jgi:hypothetical protein
MMEFHLQTRGLGKALSSHQRLGVVVAASVVEDIFFSRGAVEELED